MIPPPGGDSDGFSGLACLLSSPHIYNHRTENTLILFFFFLFSSYFFFFYDFFSYFTSSFTLYSSSSSSSSEVKLLQIPLS